MTLMAFSVNLSNIVASETAFCHALSNEVYCNGFSAKQPTALYSALWRSLT